VYEKESNVAGVAKLYIQTNHANLVPTSSTVFFVFP